MTQVEGNRNPVHAVLDRSPDQTCLIARDGTIRFVNASWTRFAEANGYSGETFVGQNYLEACGAAEGVESADATRISDGLREIVGGRKADFSHIYPCHAPNERRWFKVQAYPIDDTILVQHVDVTQAYEALPRYMTARRDAEIAFKVRESVNQVIGMLQLAQNARAKKTRAANAEQNMQRAIDYAIRLVDRLAPILVHERLGAESEGAVATVDVRSEIEKIWSSRPAAARSIAMTCENTIPEGVKLQVPVAAFDQIISLLLKKAAGRVGADGRISVYLGVNNQLGVVMEIAHHGAPPPQEVLDALEIPPGNVAADIDQVWEADNELLVANDKVLAVEGMLEVDADPNKGVMFIVRFPVWRTILDPGVDDFQAKWPRTKCPTIPGSSS